MKIIPITHPLSATVRVPGSKSLTNRALFIAALADGTTHLTNALFSDDSRYFAKALQTLGFDVQLDEANFNDCQRSRWKNPSEESRTLHWQCRHGGEDLFPRSSRSETANIFWTANRACVNVPLVIWWIRSLNLAQN